jgi:hypothetical protein
MHRGRLLALAFFGFRIAISICELGGRELFPRLEFWDAH